jgi:transposase
VTDVDTAQVQAALVRIESQVDSADFALVKGLVTTLTFVLNLLRAHKTTMARLRRFFGLSTSEKTRKVLGGQGKPGPVPPKRPGSEPAAASGQANDGSATAPGDPAQGVRPEKPKVKGHGRVPASEYETATHLPIPHQSLHPGGTCPGCACGKLYDLKEPARLLRIVGQPILAALCWDCQRLRCTACGHVYTAQAPKEAQGPKFDETAVSMIALCRYSVGLPHNRLEHLQQNLQTPIPSSTQWDVLNEAAPTFQPILEQMKIAAAQGSVVHDDDTYVRILGLMGQRRAELLARGELADPERTGLFTTAILSITDQGPIAVFCSGRKYAGENLADLLQARQADQEPPLLMSDGLQSRNVPKGHLVVEANCTAHARRHIIDQVENFPADCEYVLKMLGKVYKIDAQCKEQGLSAAERLVVHQRDSAPVMNELHRWMTEQFTEKRVEPNSGLGQAYQYMLKRWDKLTLFLRREGAPLDNNICERALKKAIVHRRNSLFYRSQRGADVGDLFMSLIYTAELHGENPFDYLTEVQRHAKVAAQKPAEWLPWTYRATLERLGERETSSRAPPPRPKSPRSPSTPVQTSPVAAL